MFAASSYAYQQVMPINAFKMRTTAEVEQKSEQKSRQLNKKPTAAVDAKAALWQKAQAMKQPQAMSAKGLRPKATEFNSTPVAAPFVCDFTTEASFNDSWVVIDANSDGFTWEYDDYTLTFGTAMLRYNHDDITIGSDDYMITSHPVTMKEGTANIFLQFGGGNKDSYENLELLYGTTTDVSQMTQIKAYENFQGGNIYADHPEFTIPEAGDYYFAIHGTSAPNQLAAIVSYFRVADGAYIECPDIIVTNISLPTPSPQLDSEQITVTVSNNGEAGLNSFSLQWTAECNGTTQASPFHTFDIELPVGGTAEVTLDTPIDMSQIGIHTITVNAQCTPAEGAGEEILTANNSSTATTTHFGTTDVPTSTDFSTGEHPMQWYSNGSWQYTEAYGGGILCIGTNPLYSQGLNLEAGKTYRLTYSYMAGEYKIYNPEFGLGTEYPDDYYIACCKVGEEPLKILTDESYTAYEFISEEATFTCNESGVYQFMFGQKYPYETFILQSVSITEIFDYNLALSGIAGNPTMIPASQTGEVQATILVDNRGGMSASGSVDIAVNGTTVTTVPFDAIPANDGTNVLVTFPLNTIAAGKTAEITATVTIDGQQDGDTAVYTASVSIAVTDDVLAYDKAIEEMYDPNNGIGASESHIIAGIPVHVSADDVLTGISVGWGIANGQEITLSVYKYNPDEAQIGEDANGEYFYYMLGEEMYSGTTSQGTEIGQIDYSIAPTALPAGDYMICVDYTDYCLICDGTPYNMIYSIDNGAAFAQEAVLGVPTIRGIFSDNVGVTDASMGDTSLKLYPNPASENLTITGKQIESVTIYSATGAAVATVAADAGTVSYDVTGLAAGIYFANVKSATGTEVIKFIVK